ncbi:pentapeptide repeat-containing protein [Streptomyces sp. NPDC041068]|uniref:pentapeptide repeat-containing protein n=1 Tax=Streptomyces sp. NPDC041068 TaxID=3155130 RepID=UPI0033E18966
MEDSAKRLSPWQWTAVVVLVVVAAGAMVTAVVQVPWLVEGDRVKDGNGDLVPAAGIIITGLRTALIAIVAGAIAALGLWYTHKKHALDRRQLQQAQEQFQLAQRQFEHAQEQFAHTQAKDREQADLAREAQVTDRYVEAIKLLSSGDDTQRLGGIYSLERTMRDSEKDHATIVAVLAAFIRQHAPVEGFLPRPDEVVQAAVTVLGRRPVREEATRLDLRRTNLASLDLSHGNFTRARLAGANLREADLQHADFSRAWAPKADFRRSYAISTKFHGAYLRKARFSMEQVPVGMSEFNEVVTDPDAGTNNAPERESSPQGPH